MLGYSVQEMEWLTYSDFVHPGDLPLVERHLEEHLRGKKEPMAFEVRCRTKQGGEIIAEVYQGPYSPAGAVVGVTWEFLYFARQRPPDRRPTDINETLKRTVSLVGPDLRIGNIHLEFNLDEKLPLVSADQDQLQQVLLNLLSNAQAAMPGGGRLLLKTDTIRANGKSLVELRVKDTGEGIDPENYDKLFEPFFTTKPEREGNSLGLDICKGIIDSYGGSIWAKNISEGGTAF
jgi:signal transduction histidine kinase